jgi:hypothetical protein
MATVGGDGTPLPAPHGDSCRWPQPPRVVPSHGIALGLEWLGQAPTPITVTRLGMHRLHPRPQGHLVTIHPGCSVTLGIGVQSAATHRQHLTPHGQRPGLLVLDETGLSPVASRATKPRALCKIARAIRQRLVSSRTRWQASWSRDTRPCPGNAPCFVRSTARFQRPSLVALSPRLRAASATA